MIDLDERDYDKAFKIRQAFHNRGLHAYVALSKSKGFHIYTFAEGEPFKAKEIRLICNDIIREINFPGIEVFPKQDHLDQVIPLGNYINLPCFGNSNRQFMSEDKVKVGVKEALEKIKGTPPEDITLIAGTIKPPAPRKRETPVKGRAKSNKAPPPCINSLLTGVSAGSRDNAAFALARYYLDRVGEAEAVTALEHWNQRNTPPLESHTIEEKIRSAGKKYGFGCSSIRDDPLLASYCVGEERCPWFKEITKGKKKEGLIREASFFEDENAYYEEILHDKKPVFMRYDKVTQETTILSTIELPDGVSVVPIFGEDVTLKAIILPTGIEEYNSDEKLVEEMEAFMKHYLDLKDPTAYKFLSYYIFTTWIHDKLNTIGYIRFLADTGCGKSRAVNVIGQLCYKPIIHAAPNSAPIYRMIRRWGGTVLLDEADFRDDQQELITILNAGFQKGRPVIRCKKDNPDELEFLPTYGPKVFASRFKFKDVALEARCHVFKIRETSRREVPTEIGPIFDASLALLQKKLLLWRFRHVGEIDASIGETLDIGAFEPRVKQVVMPFAIAFWENPKLRSMLIEYCKAKEKQNIVTRNESLTGIVLFAFFKQCQIRGKEYVTSQMVADYMNEELYTKNPIHYKRINTLLSSCDVPKTPKKRRHPEGGNPKWFYDWDEALMEGLCKRYIDDSEEFSDLFIDMAV